VWRQGEPLKVLLQRTNDDGPVRAHLDLATTDQAAEVARLSALGAGVVRKTPQWTTLRDPAGLEFCVTRRRPSADVPQETT
jgi:Glyoxalase-like domain